MADQRIEGKLSVADSIGIGTDTPNAQLHIDADVGEGKVFVESERNLFKLVVDGTGATIGTANPISLTLKTDDNGRLTIDPIGNIGIDKANPSFKLDVNGIVNATGFNKSGVPWKLQTVDLGDNAVTSAKIADLNVTTNELAALAVTEAKLANNAVTAVKIVDGAIVTPKIATAAITTDKLADNSVVASKIADGAITAAKLSLRVGRIGVGTDTPTQLLDVAGVTKTQRLRLGDKWLLSGVGDQDNDDWLRLFNVAGSGYYGGLAASKLWSSSGSLAGSDRRLKTDITPIAQALTKLTQLQGVSFRWNDAARGTGQQLGLIAQEVEAILPELVEDGPDGMKSVNYSGLIPVLIEALKAQQQQITQLQAEMQSIKQFA